MTDATAGIERHHHITLCVGSAQEDYDFHTGVLGLKSVKVVDTKDDDTVIKSLKKDQWNYSALPSPRLASR